MDAFLQNFHFLRPAWLLAIPLTVGAWWLIRRARDPFRGWRSVMDRELLEGMAESGSSRHHWQDDFPFLAAILLSLAVAGPAWRQEPSPFADDPAPVLLLLRADETMALSDLPPSRLERAQLEIADLADARKGQPTGLLAYAGSPHLVLPPTRDTGVVADMAANISPAIMPRPGEDLSSALRLADRTLAETGGSLVIVADTALPFSGENPTALPLYILAIARDDTPELDSIRSTAAALDAEVILMTADDSDTQKLARKTAQAPIRIAGDEAGTRWAEDGWWLIPLVVLLWLGTFRREETRISGKEAAA